VTETIVLGKHLFNCNVIDCNIKLLGLNSKQITGQTKKNNCLSNASDTVHMT